MKDVDRNLVDAALNLGVKRNSWFLFKEVVFPSAVPHILTGMRIALTYAWGGIVAAEMLAASNGLGWMIEANRRFHFPERWCSPCCSSGSAAFSSTTCSSFWRSA